MSEDETLDPSTPDQLRMRAAAEEIKAILTRERLGGTIALCSEESSEWLIHLPDWVGISFEGNKLGVHLSSKRQEEMNLTVSFLGAMRDMAGDFSRVFGQIFKVVRQEIGKHGGVVEHKKWGGEGHGPAGPDPKAN